VIALDQRAVAGAGVVLIAAASADSGLHALARRLGASGVAAEVTDVATGPAETGDLAAALEARYGVTLGQFAQSQPSSAAVYAPGLAAPRNALAAERLNRQFAAAFGYWERVFAARKPRMLVVRQGAPFAALQVARVQRCAIRSLEPLPGGLAYWSDDAHGAFPAGGQPSGGAVVAERLTNAEVDRTRAPRSSIPRSLVRHLQGRRWTSGGFAAALPDAPTVLFALEAEPSFDIVRQSPDFTDQHVAIVALSRDLQAGARIAVLEHPDMFGRRPPNFYRQLRDLKNTVLLPSDLPLSQALRGSAAVAGIAGIGLMHAALLGKPVIALGAHFPARRLANVHCPADIGDMRAEIAAAFAGGDEIATRATNLRAVGSFSFVVDGPDGLPMPGLD
jgi:hypothetical protein